MRPHDRTSVAILICAFAALAACGRGPIGTQPRADGSADAADGSGRAGSTGKAGTSGAAGTVGSAGNTGLAGTVGTAGATGVAGTGSAGTNGVAGTGGGPCTPGAMICTGPNQAVVCTAGGTWNTDLKYCSYGCFKETCRECAPGDSMCSTPNSVQVCPADGAKWSPPTLCDNGCTNGRCAPHCQPGEGQCMNNDQDVRRCTSGGLWGVPVNCEHGCFNGACRTCEPSSGACLTAKTGRRCQDDGTWGMTFTCATACEAGLCTDCQPGELKCIDEKSMRSCNEFGSWEPAQVCAEGVCLNDDCRQCKPGSTRCGDDGSIQLCDNEGIWGDPTSCLNACKGSACTTNPKKVFVTSTTYKGGDLGGLAGADAKCQARAAAGGLTGTFRAWLSDATGSPFDRFKRDGGPYLLVTGSIVANNWSGLTSGTLRHAINVTELGTPAAAIMVAGCPAPVVWTDTNSDGSLFEAALTCGDWTDSTVFAATWGTTASQSEWSQSCTTTANLPAVGCAALAPIYCFEQ